MCVYVCVCHKIFWYGNMVKITFPSEENFIYGTPMKSSERCMCAMCVYVCVSQKRLYGNIINITFQSEQIDN